MTNHEHDMVWIHYKLVRKPKTEGEGVIMNVGILAKLYRQARMAIMEVRPVKSVDFSYIISVYLK